MELYKFNNLTDEDQKISKEMYWLIDDLRIFQNNANQKLFSFLFPDRYEHLFHVFLKTNRNCLEFFDKVDIAVKSMIIVNIIKHKQRDGFNMLYINCK